MDTLPLQLTSFIGREQELAEVRRLIFETRLLTLTGPGGCGKTRLAFQAAEGLGGFADGVCCVELAAMAEPALIVQLLLSALGVPEQPDRPLPDVLRAHLRDRQLLLILDNCEHLTEACAQLTDMLLHGCPSLRVLATSRERLGVSGERVWLVPSLAIPPPSAPGASLPPLEELAQVEAVRLFVERAEATARTFRLTEQNARSVAQICRRLDGIPLAIELAAARTPFLTAEQIAAELDNSFRLLGAGGRTLLPRHRTLAAAMDWSYGLLSQAEQALLRRLSIFSGGFGLEAAEAICADHTETQPVIDPGDTLDILARLVDKSLVTVHEQNGIARYSLLEIIRQYGRAQLAELQEEETLRRRHLDWHLALAEQADAKVTDPDRAEWVARIQTEHDNVRAALEWSLAPAVDAVSPEKGMRLAIAMSSFWSFRGHSHEGSIWMERVLAQSRGISTVLHAEALARAGYLAWTRNDFAQATALLTEGQSLARSLGAEARFALQIAVNALGSVAYYQDEYARATAQFEEWLAFLKEHGDHTRIPFAFSWLGRVAVRQGEYARASVLGEESLALSLAQDNVHSIAATLNLLGTVAYCLGDSERATSFLEESIARSRVLSNPQDVADTLVVLANVALRQGNLRRATDAVDESLAISRQLGYPQGIALSQCRLGEAARAAGDFGRAEALLKESLALFDHLGAAWHLLHTLEEFAALRVEQAQPRQAAWLAGAVAAQRETRGAARPPVEQPAYERTIAAARSALGAADFAAAWEKGTRMSLAQAVASALHDAPAVSASGVTAADSLQAAAPPLRICALGPPEVYRAGALVTTAEWGYAKPRELFFYLLCHPARTREQIGLVFWPEASPAQLRSRLHASLHRLREALGSRDWVIFEGGRYAFNRALDYSFDAELFESRLKSILSKSEATAAARDAPLDTALDTALEETLGLYRGDFLEAVEPHDWVLLRREALRSRYVDGAMALGRLRFAAGHYERAAEAFRRVIAHDVCYEAAHRELMRCLARLDAAGQALRHYQALVETLREEVGAPPAPETAALAESLRRGERG